MDPKPLIENFAEEAARRSGLPEPERTEARQELVSHLYEKVHGLAVGQEPTREHVKQAIRSLGSRTEIHRAFFGSYTHAHPPAAWGRRAGAFAVDIIVMMVISTFILGFFVSPLETCDEIDARLCVVMNVPGPVSFKFTHGDPETEALDAFHVAFIHGMHSYVSTLAFLAYFTILEASWGRTVGKHAFGIRVFSANGPLPSFLQSIGRNLSKVVLPLLVLDWLLGWAASGNRRLRVSDSLAKTLVART